MSDLTDPLAGSLADIIDHGQPADLPVPADAEPMISTSIRLPLDLLDWARAEASRRALPSWSALVRTLLDAERHPTTDDALVSVAQLRQLLDQLAHRSSTA